METLSGVSQIRLRLPQPEDGSALNHLVKACPPLDENSVYCNLLQATHFAATSVLGEADGQLVSAVTGYLVPGRDDTLFIWQVAVSEHARGQGIAGQMLDNLLARPACQSVEYLETTITDSNEGSWALFEGLARRLGTQLQRSPMFERATHFDGAHETETLARIGPFSVSLNGSGPSHITEFKQENRA
jgi:L-2,4-diaminobutyric acid acetyltransferase